jgi:hypothetical protein
MQKKPLTVEKNVKHTFTPEETATLNVEFRQSYANLKAVEADAASVKSQLKAKVDEAQAQMDLKNSLLQAGYEMRLKRLVVIFRPADKKKDYYLPKHLSVEGVPAYDKDTDDTFKPVLTEDMTQEDFEVDLIQAEAAFENKVELILWEAGNDKGKLVVGEQKGRWFAAVRGNVGTIKIEERLDSEQLATKKRFDAITRATKRLNEWLKVNLGKDAAKGFAEAIDKVIEGEKDKAE